MTPQPASATDNLIALVNNLMTTATPPSSFDLARLDTGIRNLKNIDAAQSQCLRGIYYALQGDLENTTKWFNMAIASEQSNPDIYMNYAASLCYLGLHAQSLKMTLESINKGNYTPQAIHNLILSAYYADDQSILDEWLPKYEKLTGKPSKIALWLQEDAEDEAEIKRLGDDIRNGPYIGLDKICKELGL